MDAEVDGVRNDALSEAPSRRRETEQRFWKQIATGITSERAAEAVRVSQAVGMRRFRHRGANTTFYFETHFREVLVRREARRD